MDSAFINPDKYSSKMYCKCRDFSSLEEVLDFVRGVQEGKITGMDYGLWSLMYTGHERPNGKKEVEFRLKWPTIGKKFVDILAKIPENASISYEDIFSSRSFKEDQAILSLLSRLPYLTISLSFESSNMYEFDFHDYRDFPTGDYFRISILKMGNKEDILKRARDYNIPLKEERNSLILKDEAIEKIKYPKTIGKIEKIDDCTKKNILNLGVDLYGEAFDRLEEYRNGNGNWIGCIVHPIYNIDYHSQYFPMVNYPTSEIIETLKEAYNVFGGEGSPSRFKAKWKGPFYEVEITNNAGHVTKEILIGSSLSEIDKAIEEVLG